MNVEEQLLLKTGFVFGWLLCLFIWERLAPASTGLYWRNKWDSLQRTGRNLGLWLANVGLSPLVILPLTLWATEHTVEWRPSEWRGAGALLFDLLLLDFWIYWWHRANHKLPLLWRFHRVHHLDEHLDTTSALRFHAGEIVLSALVRVVVILVLDVPFGSVLIFETLVLICTIFHHSNIRLYSGIERTLSKLIITPGIHWVHHHAVRRDTDSNYGTVLSCWDHLFNSCSSTVRTATMRIGLQGESERSFVKLMIAPFQSSRGEDGTSTRVN